MRSSIKFAPWELSHGLIWQLILVPRGATPPFLIAGFALVYVVVGIYLGTLLIGSTHRTLYDRLSGSRVVVPSIDPHR